MSENKRSTKTRFHRPAEIPAMSAIAVALVLLVLVSPVLAPGSLDSGSLLTMLPFAGVLVIAALGQTLVIQQRGLDLSVPGVMAASAAVVTTVSDGSDGRFLGALLLALGIGALAGAISGAVVTRLGVTPLIATLAMNALLTGLVLQVTGGVPKGAPPRLADFAVSKVAGVPVVFLLAIALTAIVAAIVNRTVLGRRFQAVGSGTVASRSAGISTRAYEFAAYVAAGVLYALAGVVLAGLLQTPGSTVGDPYLLSTIAAVVIGGTALGGGAATQIGTALGAIFLAQLNQVLLSIGADTSIQYLIQGVLIALAVALANARGLFTRRVVAGADR